jgi:multidrug efflux pump subunit AcrB
LLGFIIVGPLGSIITVSVVSWLMTHFPLQMKRLALAGVLFFLLAGGYYFRSFFFSNVMHQSLLYRYRLQSANLDDLHRYAPVIEAQLRELPVLKDVSVDSQLKSDQAIVDVDPQKATVPGSSSFRR